MHDGSNRDELVQWATSTQSLECQVEKDSPGIMSGEC